ncbi:hypothetical protein [Aeromonas veronii]|uniref:hypothetical protein n=1 Tax=Aeromonas veronii TaxID=654 RepID=UPI000EB04EF8|nr:hypothetical protein [Aeromonas veronii]AYK20443.1 hypothetical protein C0073_022030 [Aeromonas veronii]AYK20519.1 hypothetical protein C0073_022740 [Aeromonas veronii]
MVVREWAGKNNTIIANLALANVSAKAPVYAYVQIVREAHRLDRYGVSPRIQQLLRLFLAHCAKLWKDKGYTEVRLWLRDNNQSSLSVMLDYLDAEGFEQGSPTSTRHGPRCFAAPTTGIAGLPSSAWSRNWMA